MKNKNPINRAAEMLINVMAFGGFLVLCIFVYVAFIYDAEAKTYTDKPMSGYYMTQVDKVYDGDTFYGWTRTFIYQGTYMKIRIRGISAPEIRGSDACEKKLAYASRDYLKKILTSSSFIRLDKLGYDSFGRVLAEVNISQGSVAVLMIQAGYARPYIKGDTMPWCVSS